MLALHIHGSQLTLSNTHAFHHVETSEQACRPILLGLRHHVWDYSRDGSNLHHRLVRLASPGRRMRFAYVLILGITWGTEWSRWIQTGQMFLVHFFCIEALFRLVSFPMFSCLCRLATHVDLQGLAMDAIAGQATRTSWSRCHGYLEQVLVASTARTRYEMLHTLFTWFLFGASCTMQLAFASYAYDFECVSVSS